MSVTKDAIMSVLYRNEAKDEAEIKIVDVFLCKLRKKLAPFDIGIETIWGVGYAMNDRAKAAYYALWPQDLAA